MARLRRFAVFEGPLISSRGTIYTVYRKRQTPTPPPKNLACHSLFVHMLAVSATPFVVLFFSLASWCFLVLVQPPPFPHLNLFTWVNGLHGEAPKLAPSC